MDLMVSTLHIHSGQPGDLSSSGRIGVQCAGDLCTGARHDVVPIFGKLSNALMSGKDVGAGMAKFTVLLERVYAGANAGRITKHRAYAALATLSLIFAGTAILTIALGMKEQTLLVYVGLFMTSLVAGTMLPFLPASSELAMATLLASGVGEPPILLATAAGGSLLGATANYVVGWKIGKLAAHPWFPISQVRLQKTAEWFNRYGIWLVVMCWLPTAGDAITVVAGLLRADFRSFLLLAATGKTFGHVAVAGGVSWIV